MAHALLQPSSAHRWVHCFGSVQAEGLYPQPPTDAAEEGTAAHWVASSMLESYKANPIKTPICFIDKPAPNGVIVTDEMIEGIGLYVKDVLKVVNDNGLLQSMIIEQPVPINRVHPDNWGTPDLRIYDKDALRLHVWDFKFGRRVVEHWENWQLIDYGIGGLDEIGNGIDDQHITVELHIVQPRAFHVDGPVRSWSMIGSDLRGYANKLSAAAEKATDINPLCRAGEWCRDCNASRACSALQIESAGIVDRVEALNLHDLSPEDTAVELRYLRRADVLLGERLKGLETQTMEQHANGTPTPGFGIGYGQGSIKWDKPNNEVIELGDLLGIDLRKPEAPITPTQAKKLKVDEAVIKSYSKKHQGSARLVTDDKTIAGRIFAKR